MDSGVQHFCHREQDTEQESNFIGVGVERYQKIQNLITSSGK